MGFWDWCRHLMGGRHPVPPPPPQVAIGAVFVCADCGDPDVLEGIFKQPDPPLCRNCVFIGNIPDPQLRAKRRLQWKAARDEIEHAPMGQPRTS